MLVSYKKQSKISGLHEPIGFYYTTFLDQVIISLQEYLKEKERLLKIKLHLYDLRKKFNKPEVNYVQPFKKLVS